MERQNAKTRDYPSLSYQKTSTSKGHNNQRISLGGLNENFAPTEKKRHIRTYDGGDGTEHEKTERSYMKHHQERKHRQSDDDEEDDEYEEEFNRLSIGSPDRDTRRNNGKQTQGYYPSIQVNQGEARRSERKHRHDDEEVDDEVDERSVRKSPASPLLPPRSRDGNPKSHRVPPATSPRLLRSRSPNNLSPRTPSPGRQRSKSKEQYAYYEEDVDLKIRPKSTSPRDKTQNGIPSLADSSFMDHQNLNKKRSPRDKHKGDTFDWNDYITPSPRSPREVEDHETDRYKNTLGESGGRRRERGRTSTDSPPLSPLSSSGGSSSRSPRSESDYLSSSGERSSRDFPRPTHVPPVPRKKKGTPTGAKLEPIDYR